MRRERRAVVEPRLFTQQEGVSELVRRDPHLLGDEAVVGVAFVEALVHQTVEDERHARRRIAPQHIGVETVIGRACRRQRQSPSLGGFRIHVAEKFEVGRLAKVAKGRKAVAFDFALREGTEAVGGGGRRARLGQNARRDQGGGAGADNRATGQANARQIDDCGMSQM